MAAERARLTALVTIEEWSEDGPAGYLVRALVRAGDDAQDVIGPDFAPTLEEVRNRLAQVDDVLVTTLGGGARKVR